MKTLDLIFKTITSLWLYLLDNTTVSMKRPSWFLMLSSEEPQMALLMN